MRFKPLVTEYTILSVLLCIFFQPTGQTMQLPLFIADNSKRACCSESTQKCSLNVGVTLGHDLFLWLNDTKASYAYGGQRKVSLLVQRLKCTRIPEPFIQRLNRTDTYLIAVYHCNLYFCDITSYIVIVVSNSPCQQIQCDKCRRTTTSTDKTDIHVFLMPRDLHCYGVDINLRWTRYAPTTYKASTRRCHRRLCTVSAGILYLCLGSHSHASWLCTVRSGRGFLPCVT